MNQMKMNFKVKQQRCTITISKIRGGVLTKNLLIILIRERMEKVDYREKSFYDFRLMIVDPPQKLDRE